jgi:DNA-binding IclR family transcriptional regulator
MEAAGSLQKAFRVLEALAAQPGPVSLAQLAQHTHLNKATLHRILHSLMALGYASQLAETGHYRLTPKLSQVGRASQQPQLVAQALPLMQQLHQRFNETVNLGVLEGVHIHYLHYLETTQALRWTVRPGSRDPFYSTALGRAIVAHLPQSQQQILLAQTQLEGQTPHTVANLADLRSLLSETRRRGWALDNEENDLGVVCLGIPLFQDEQVVGGLSISVPVSRLSPQLQLDLVEALLALRPLAGAL